MMDMQELVKEFADCVEAQGNEIRRGNAATGNIYAERYNAAFEKLRAIGNKGRDALAPLLFDRRVDVRVTAAAYLLRYKYAEAKAVLEREAKGRGFIAFDAEQALERWREGTWALDSE